jgi:hypothetical protein
MSLMQDIQNMDPKQVASRPEVKALWDKSLFWALSHRRSHRNPLGVEVPRDEFFDYKTVKEPVPLSAVELALLCWSISGTNGLLLGDGCVYTHSYDFGWEGTVNESVGTRWFNLFFNNDDGLFLYRRHVPTKMSEIETQEDMEVIFRAFKEGVTKLADGNMVKDPFTSPAVIHPGNDSYTFKPGTTQFFLLTDTTVNFMVMAEHAGVGSKPESRPIFIDDATGKPAGVKKWVDNGYLKGPRVPLSFTAFKVLSLSLIGAFAGLQNLGLVASGMGLGVFPHLAGTEILMGLSPAMRGLGFRWASDKRGNPYPVGIDGICQGHIPPYMSIDEAVDNYFDITYGAKGSFNPATKDGDGVTYTGFSKDPRGIHRPYKDPDKWLKTAQQYARVPEARLVVKDLCNYVYNTYGRIPFQVDPFVCPCVIQVHHIDPDFYQEYWVEGAVSKEQREHLSTWHGINK